MMTRGLIDKKPINSKEKKMNNEKEKNHQTQILIKVKEYEKKYPSLSPSEIFYGLLIRNQFLILIFKIKSLGSLNWKST